MQIFEDENFNLFSFCTKEIELFLLFFSCHSDSFVYKKSFVTGIKKEHKIYREF